MRRPLEREGVDLDCGRRTPQLKRHPLGGGAFQMGQSLITFIAYVLSLAAAHLGGLLGILVSGAALQRLGAPSADVRLYSLNISSGPTGLAQEIIIALGRALVAFLAAKTVLKLFDLPFTLLAAAMVGSWILACDLYSLAIAGHHDLYPMEQERAHALRAKIRYAIPIDLGTSILVAWIFLGRS